ncbi:MAG: S-layer homology domain-containing protein, partial [Clostridia bacterium]|nr:S-layer homology domain-containing protein [Clostridia bacterium]
LAEDGVTSMIYKITFRVVGEELAKLGKNLLTNSGFENGNLDGYTWKPTTWHGLKLINDPENVHTGSYAALVENIENVQSHFYYNSASAGPNRTYLVSAWVKLKSENDNHKKFEMHPGSGTKVYRDEEYVSALKREWKQIITTIETDDAATSLNPMAVCWATPSGYYLDDLYVGELKPSLRYLGETEVEISATAEVLVDLKAEIVNQFGTANGLKYAAVTDWEIISDTYGVSIKDNDVLVISPDAEAGTVRIKATFDPAYLGDDLYTKVWSEVVEITLTDDGNTTPKAKGIKISGTVATGLPLSVDYRYYQVDGDPQSGSQIQWLWAETANGSYEEIPGAIGLNYTVESAYADKFISVKVLPKSAGGLTGVWTQCSSYLYRDTAPEAKDVKVTPSVSAYGIGDTLTGSYQYFDINGDEETGTSFSWLRYNDADSRWDAIAGATGKTYVLTEADIDKKLMFEVTPRAEKEPNPGALGLSREINGPSRPHVTNASFRSLSNNLLAASYTYHHPNGVAEGNTEIKWYVDGNYAGSGSSVTISSKGTKSICLEITPKASKEPIQGETVRVTGTVTGSSGNGGGGGGISSGGKVVSVPQLPSESEPVVPTEPTKHWASDAVAWAVAEGYMESADMLEGKLDTQMNREKFLTSVLKAVGLKPVEYRNEFADVADGEFAKLLQAAVDSGIISKYDNFYPQRSISREEICKIIVTAISAAGADANQSADIGTFTDNASIAEWAKGYVAQLVGIGILKGVSETEFMPKGNVTVAQTAIILQRIMDYMN